MSIAAARRPFRQRHIDNECNSNVINNSVFVAEFWTVTPIYSVSDVNGQHCHIVVRILDFQFHLHSDRNYPHR